MGDEIRQESKDTNGKTCDTVNPIMSNAGLCQLLPCPFCSGETIAIGEDEMGQSFYICEDCGAHGPELEYEDQAKEAWNKRVETELEQKYKWQVRDTCKRAEKAEKKIAELENMLEDVVNVLDLSDAAIAEHGPLGTPPAEIVRLVLAEKDRVITMLKAGMRHIET